MQFSKLQCFSWQVYDFSLVLQKISWRLQTKPPLAITQNSDYHGRAQQNDKQHLLSTLELLAMKQEKNYKGGEKSRQGENRNYSLPTFCCLSPFHISYQTNLSVSRKKYPMGTIFYC